MPKLNQIIAIEKGVKNKWHNTSTALHRSTQAEAMTTGVARKYDPHSEEDVALEPEVKRVQVSCVAALHEIAAVSTELFDVTATKDMANAKAKADVVIGETVILKGVPVTHLLFLEKKLKDLETFVTKLPVLDPGEEWAFDSNANIYASKPTKKTRTKKVFVAITMAPATDKHPAQIKETTEDKVAGTWTETKFSGALPAQRRAELLERLEKLQRAVKFAREECNSAPVEEARVGAPLFSYLFG